jgi:tRNA-dihydrouridine synthase C
MNYLRQGFSEAEALWPQARKIREVAPMFDFLNQATAVDPRLIDVGQQPSVANRLN